jgi:hypothetical protein
MKFTTTHIKKKTWTRNTSKYKKTALFWEIVDRIEKKKYADGEGFAVVFTPKLCDEFGQSDPMNFRRNIFNLFNGRTEQPGWIELHGHGKTWKATRYIDTADSPREYPAIEFVYNSEPSRVMTRHGQHKTVA